MNKKTHDYLFLFILMLYEKNSNLPSLLAICGVLSYAQNQTNWRNYNSGFQQNFFDIQRSFETELVVYLTEEV